MLKRIAVIWCVLMALPGLAQTDANAGIMDIFLSLPDTVFTHAPHVPFLKNDSFPVAERKLLAGDSVPGYPHREPQVFDLLSLNQPLRLLTMSNGPYTLSLKCWELGQGKWLVGIATQAEDFVKPPSSIQFFLWDGKRVGEYPNSLPGKLLLSTFFPAAELKKNGIGMKETVPELNFRFSDSLDAVEVRPDPFYFDPNYQEPGDPLVHLDWSKMKTEVVYCYFRAGKFIAEIPRQP
jgi:hypothetical protein